MHRIPNQRAFTAQAVSMAVVVLWAALVIRAVWAAAPRPSEPEPSPRTATPVAVPAAFVRPRGGAVGPGEVPGTGADAYGVRDTALDLTLPCPSTLPPRLDR